MKRQNTQTLKDKEQQEATCQLMKYKIQEMEAVNQEMQCKLQHMEKKNQGFHAMFDAARQKKNSQMLKEKEKQEATQQDEDMEKKI